MSELNITETELKDFGWYDVDLANKVFLVWFSKGRAQLCEVDMTKLEYKGPKRGLNSEHPYFFSYLRKQQQQLDYLVITRSPIVASMFAAKSIPAIAVGSGSPRIAQIRHIAALDKPVLFFDLDGASGHTNAEKTVLALSRFTDVNVCLPKTWMDVFSENDLEQYFLKHEREGIDFLGHRLVEKLNGKSDYERAIDIMKAANMVGKRNAGRLTKIVESQNPIHLHAYADALRLLSELLDTQMPIEKARRIVIDRYGISVFVRSVNGAELF